jgi:hypothetical protein
MTGTSSQMLQSVRLRVALTLLLSALFVVGSCKYPEGPPLGNTPPRTRLANVPANDTIAQYIRLGATPEVTLFWLGDDPDGFVIAYKYRWTEISRLSASAKPWTTVLNISTLGGAPIQQPILVKGEPQSLFAIYNLITTLDPVRDSSLVRVLGDSLATQRSFLVPYRTGIVAGDSLCGANTEVNETPTKGTFIFDSPLDSNMHRFEVASVDNKDAIDPAPAVVNFWTLRSPEPIAVINAIPPPDQYAIRYKTETFAGLPFAFSTLDPSTFDQEYSWSVDDTVDWSPWSPDGTAFVTASSFDPIASGTHTFYLRARNRWGAVSAIVARPFTAFVPAFDDPNFPRRTLIISNDVNGNGTPGKPDTNQVKSFYAEIMDSAGRAGRYDIWISSGRVQNVFPSREMLGNYSSLLILLEQTLPVLGPDRALRISADTSGPIGRYLGGGGKLIISGPPDGRKQIVSLNDAFFTSILHTAPILAKNPALDFIGAFGRLGYPDLLLDASKIQPDSGGALRNIELNYPRSFAQTIFLFNSKSDGQYESQPVGIRFLAPPPVPPARATYSVVYFGFPLYYAEKSAATQTLQQAFVDVNE